MLARPSAMPSFFAMPRCVTRESSCTASNRRRSRCDSTSMFFTCSGLPEGRSLLIVVMVVMILGLVGELPFGFGPIFLGIDADRSLDRHRIRDHAIAVQARRRREQKVRAAGGDGAL